MINSNYRVYPSPGTLADVSQSIDFEIYYKLLTLFGKGTLVFNLKNTVNLELEYYSRKERDRLFEEVSKKIADAKSLGFHLDVSYRETFKDVRRKSISIKGSANVMSEQIEQALFHFGNSLAKAGGLPKSWLKKEQEEEEELDGSPSNLLFLGINFYRPDTLLLFPNGDPLLDENEVKQMKDWHEKFNWRTSDFPNVTAGNNFHYNDNLFFSRNGHTRGIWLLDGTVAFETCYIGVDCNLEIISCSWPTFSSMPFRTSKEFISLMSSDDVFRSNMLILEKDNLRAEYCNLFFQRLVEDVKQRTYSRFLPDLHLKKKNKELF